MGRHYLGHSLIYCKFQGGFRFSIRSWNSPFLSDIHGSRPQLDLQRGSNGVLPVLSFTELTISTDIHGNVESRPEPDLLRA